MSTVDLYRRLRLAHFAEAQKGELELWSRPPEWERFEVVD